MSNNQAAQAQPESASPPPPSPSRSHNGGWVYNPRQLIPPHGWRLLNRNEPIRKSDVRWRGGGVESMEYAPISYIGLTWESVVNDVHSEATTVFIRRVAQYSIPPVPEFPGWVHIGLDAPLQAGDVAIVVRPDVFIGQGDVPTRLMSPLDGGGSILHTWHGCIGKTLRETYPQDPNIISGAWSVYRQIGVDAAPQVGQRNPRIISNPPEPLPLP